MVKNNQNSEKNHDSAFIHALCALLAKNKALKNNDAQALEKAFENSTAIYFEDFLIETDLVSKEDVLNALSEYYQMPAIDVTGIFFDHHLVTMFPKDVMIRNGFIPYERDGSISDPDDNSGNILIVVAARPRHPELPEIIGKFVSYDVTFMAGLYRDICDQVDDFYDESIELADIQMLEDTTDEHEKQEQLDDIVNED